MAPLFRLTQTPAGAALPVAVALSLAVHAVAVVAAGLALHATREGPKAAASVGRTHGALSVTLSRTAPAVVKAPAPRPALRPVSRPTVRRAAAEPPRGEPAPAPAPAPAPTPSVPAGAQFASLFAPIVHAPLGRGGWRRPAHQPPPPPDPQRAREQAAMELQLALRTRLAALTETLRASGVSLACSLAIDPEQRVAHIECAQPEDQAVPWGHLSGLLVAGTVSESASRLCFQLADQQVTAGPCATSAQGPDTPVSQ